MAGHAKDDRIAEAEFLEFMFKYEVDLVSTAWFAALDFTYSSPDPNQGRGAKKGGFRWGKRRSKDS